MKKTILSIAAAVAISLGAAGAANTASAAEVATPAVAVQKADAVNPNAGIRIRFRRGWYGYNNYGYNGYGYRYVGSYRHCKVLLHKWKVYGSWYAKRKFYRLGCARYFY
jgi:hypothetical protein